MRFKITRHAEPPARLLKDPTLGFLNSTHSEAREGEDETLEEDDAMEGMRTFAVRGEFITLGQFVKMVGAVGSGGEVKSFLTERPPLVNGEPEDRRGRKLRPGDILFLGEEAPYVLIAE